MVNSSVEEYSSEIAPVMSKKFNYDLVMETLKADKIVLDIGVDNTASSAKDLDEAVEKLTLISGQRPLITKTKKSVANFRLRKGMSIGAKIILRGDRIYDPLYKSINVSLPQVRNSRGISSRSFDGRGNHTSGIKEQLIFSKIDYDEVSRVRGLGVVTVTTANTDGEAREPLTEFGIPFAK